MEQLLLSYNILMLVSRQSSKTMEFKLSILTLDRDFLSPYTVEHLLLIYFSAQLAVCPVPPAVLIAVQLSADDSGHMLQKPERPHCRCPVLILAVMLE